MRNLGNKAVLHDPPKRLVNPSPTLALRAAAIAGFCADFVHCSQETSGAFLPRAVSWRCGDGLGFRISDQQFLLPPPRAKRGLVPLWGRGAGTVGRGSPNAVGFPKMP